MSNDSSSTFGVVVLRIYAVVLLLIGAGLLAGGLILAKLGGSLYYALCGLAVIASAVLLWMRKPSGVLVFGAMLAATFAWAIWEAGTNWWALAPRVIAPTVMGLVLLLPVVRRALIRTDAPWPTARAMASFAGAIAVGFALHELAPPKSFPDPMYQTGVGVASPAIDATPNNPTGDWPTFGNDAGGSRFSAVEQITPENVSKLEVAWTYKVKAPGLRLLVTPIKIGNSVYVCSNTNDISALDAETGQELWRFDARVDVTKSTQPICRGVAYYKTPDATGACAERIITNTTDSRLLAVDAKDGKPCADFGTNGEVSLLTGMGEVLPGYYYPTSAPTVVDGKILLGGWVADNQYWGEPSGVIRAFDAVTGKLAWAWDMGQPDRTGEPPPGETYTLSTPNSWSHMSTDVELGLVYVPTGNPTPDYFGAYRRPFDEKYGSSVVALDVATGRPRWSFQTVHHDLWDYDVASQPSVVDLTIDGETIKAIIVPNKRGELFVLDRATGEPIFPIEERPVPTTGHAPEDWVAPTQPYSMKMPSFRGADITEANMWGITPLDQLWCRIKFKDARYEGTMTPVGLTPAVHTPGYSGGMAWGSTTVDPGRRIVVVPSEHLPIYTRLLPREEADARGIKRMTAQNNQHFHVGALEAQENTPYGITTGWFMSPLYVPCTEPPYGRLSGVDLVTGKLLWTTPLGSARSLGPMGMHSHLPLKIGTFLTGGAITTKGGLTFIAASQDRTFRAFETATGKLVWEKLLAANGGATPMTYLSTDSNRQFVVIAVSGNDFINKTDADYLVAYALRKGDAKK